MQIRSNAFEKHISLHRVNTYIKLLGGRQAYERILQTEPDSIFTQAKK